LDGFLFIKEVAHGAHARIFEIQSVETGKILIAKFVDFTGGSYGRPVGKYMEGIFQNELRVLKKCSHTIEGIVKMESYIDTDLYGFLILEKIPLCLKEFQIHMLQNERARLALRVGKFLIKTCSQLHNRGFKHNDIKPENILMDLTHTRFTLCDFGLSEPVDHCSKTLLGTVPFIAPERYHYCSPLKYADLPKSSVVVDERVDTWAIGMTLYEIWFLKRPFSTIFRNSSSNLELISQKNGTDSDREQQDISDAAVIKEIKQILTKPITYPSCCIQNEKLLVFIQMCLEKDEHKRPTATQILNSSLFTKTFSDI
jgi:serine/threonine protein kinase